MAVLFGGLAVKAVHRGTATISGTNTSADFTIPAVDLAKAVPILCGATANVDDIGFLPLLSLPNATTLRASRGTALSGTTTATYAVLEFY